MVAAAARSRGNLRWLAAVVAASFLRCWASPRQSLAIAIFFCDPDLQSGFGVDFVIWSGGSNQNCRRNSQRISPQIFQPCFSRASHRQNRRHSSPISNFWTHFFVHADVLLAGETKFLAGKAKKVASPLAAVVTAILRCELCVAKPPYIRRRMRLRWTLWTIFTVFWPLSPTQSHQPHSLGASNWQVIVGPKTVSGSLVILRTI